MLVSEISEFIRPRLRIPDSAAVGFNLAALASAFNGLIGGVLFTGIFATELQAGRAKSPLQCLVWNLIAGAVGFVVYRAAGYPAFASMVPFPPAGLTPLFGVVAVLCGVLATGIAIGIGAWLQVGGEDHGSPVQRARGASAPSARALSSAPSASSSPICSSPGEAQIQDFIANPALYGAALLLLLAVLKIGLFGISIKAGYIGGPVFPILFACTLIGLALNLLVPGIPSAVFVLCLEAGAIAVALGAPLTAILLVAIVSGADQDMIVLLVLSIATALLLSAEAMKRIAARRAGTGSGATAGTR